MQRAVTNVHLSGFIIDTVHFITSHPYFLKTKETPAKQD